MLNILLYTQCNSNELNFSLLSLVWDDSKLNNLKTNEKNVNSNGENQTDLG